MKGKMSKEDENRLLDDEADRLIAMMSANSLENNEFEYKAELEREFCEAVESCFRGEDARDRVKYDYSRLRYDLRLEHFTRIRSDAVLGITAVSMGNLAAILLPEKFVVTESNAKGKSKKVKQASKNLDNYIETIDIELQILLVSIIDGMLINPSNLGDWLNNVRFSKEPNVSHEIIICFLLEAKIITVDNVGDWKESFIDFYGDERSFCQVIISSLTSSSDFLVKDLSSWYKKLLEITGLESKAMTEVSTGISDEKKIAMHGSDEHDMAKAIISIVVSKIRSNDSRLGGRIRKVLQYKSEHVYFQYMFINYLYDNKATMGNVADVARSVMPEIESANAMLSQIDDLFGNALERDSDIKEFHYLCKRVSSRTREGVLEYVRSCNFISDYLNIKLGSASSDNRSVDIISSEILAINKVIKALVFLDEEICFEELYEALKAKGLHDRWFDYHKGGIIGGEILLNIFANKAISSGDFEIGDFHNWFTQVKGLDLSDQKYYLLHRNIFTTLALKPDINVMQLKCWYDSLHLEFYLLPLFRESTAGSRVHSYCSDYQSFGNHIVEYIVGKEMPNYNISEREINNYRRFLFADLALTINELPLKLKELFDYSYRKPGAIVPILQRSQLRSNILDPIRSFLIGEADSFLIEDYLPILAQVNDGQIIDLIEAELPVLGNVPDDQHAEQFFKFYNKSCMVLFASNICTGRAEELYDNITKVLIKFAVDKSIIKPTAQSLHQFYNNTNLDYADLVQVVFAHIYQEGLCRSKLDDWVDAFIEVLPEDLDMTPLYSWIEAFVEFLPEDFALSQNTDIINADSCSNRDYLLSICKQDQGVESEATSYKNIPYVMRG